MAVVVRLSLATRTPITTYLGLPIIRLREWVDVVTEAINADRG
jgi:hypothetical protein